VFDRCGQSWDVGGIADPEWREDLKAWEEWLTSEARRLGLSIEHVRKIYAPRRLGIRIEAAAGTESESDIEPEKEVPRIDDAALEALSRGDVDREAIERESERYPGDVSEGDARGWRDEARFGIVYDSKQERYVAIDRRAEHARLQGFMHTPAWWRFTQRLVEWWCERQQKFLATQDFEYLAPLKQDDAAEELRKEPLSYKETEMPIKTAINRVNRRCAVTTIELPWADEGFLLKELFSEPVGAKPVDDRQRVSLLAALRLVELAVIGDPDRKIPREDMSRPRSDAEIAAWMNERLGWSAFNSKHVETLRNTLGYAGGVGRRRFYQARQQGREG
jgi:hypothetical protein